MKMAKPGNTASHQAKVVVLASCKIEPQVTSSAGTPMPRKLETRFDQDRARDAKNHGNNDRRQGVGQNMFEHDFAIGDPESDGGSHIVLSPDSQKFIARETRDADPTGHADDRHRKKNTRRQQRRHGNQQKKSRDRQHDFKQPRDHQIHPRAKITRDGAKDDADHDCDAHCHKADGERYARAVNHPRHDIAPELVGAEPVLRRGRLQRLEQIDVAGRYGMGGKTLVPSSFLKSTFSNSACHWASLAPTR